MNEITKIIKQRRSIRKFKGDEIPLNIIEDIVDCGRLAPTARNVQPWLIGYTTDKKILKDVSDITEYGKFIKDCGVCFSVFCLKDEKYILEDGIACTENIIIACESYGIGTCWVAGHKKPYVDDIRKLLNVPEKYTLISLIAAGYPNEEHPKINKKTIKEISFSNKY